MAKYRKKPVVIDAMVFPGFSDKSSFVQAAKKMEAFEAWLELVYNDWRKCRYRGNTLIIPTLEGDMIAQAGDYIICGVKGELYPCKPDIFEQTYEAVSDK